MAAESGADVHHGAQRCLLRLFDAAAAGLADWSEFDAEAKRLSIEVRGFSREGLRALIESSPIEIPTTEHRRLHQQASDLVGWGRRWGLRTLALYGRPSCSLLASLRWGRIEVEALIEHRAGSSKGRLAATCPRVYYCGVRGTVSRPMSGPSALHMPISKGGICSN
jgi:hypothetical protein